MKFHFSFYLISMFLAFSNPRASDLSELIDQAQGFTLCRVPFLGNLPGMESHCISDADRGFSGGDLIIHLTGLIIARNYGCGTNSFNSAPNGDQNKFYVSLLGDSLTHFGGTYEMWNAYLGGDGRFKALPLGAAGSGSSIWRELFDSCETKANIPWFYPVPPNLSAGRKQLPARSIMMVGGNDFHVFKGILIPMWFLVPFRRNMVLNNIEKIATHHHKGNNGCGDFDKNGTKVEPDANGNCKDRNNDGVVNYKDWGRGRLLVILGNLPAVSLDTSVVPGFFELCKRLGLYEKPHDELATKENIEDSKRKLLGFSALFALYYESMIPTLIAMSTYINYVNCGEITPSKICKDHSWASRQMYKLQYWENGMALQRGGIPYVHMYSFFRDGNANSRGCWWCANKELWMKDYPNVVWSAKDGIHINHVVGYSLWGSIVTPIMDQLKMDRPNREDDVVAPGEEADHGPGCDDLCLIALCYFAGICR